MAHRVRYVGREVPSSSFDGWVARLRLLDEDRYVQFFRAVALAPDLLTLEIRPTQDWWTEFILLAARQIEQLVSDGFAPTTPADAIMLRPDVGEAARQARIPNPARRHVTASEPGIEGVEIYRFGDDAFGADRRRGPR